MTESQALATLKARIQDTDFVSYSGRVNRVSGLLIESIGPPAAVGDLCHIHTGTQEGPVRAEVVGFRENVYLLMPYGPMDGIRPGCRVTSTLAPLKVPVGFALKGRVINGMGQPIDGKGDIGIETFYPTRRLAPKALERTRISEPFYTGIKAIDSCLTMGMGQRLGIFSGSGVGKSTLLGMIAKGATSEINVIALIGERGREVLEFIQEELGEEGLARSVVVVVTSDEPSLLRIKGAETATAVAEFFRDHGKNVLFMMDSLTRFATAGREVGLSIGEPPATKGYTPSVFGAMPRLLERTGMSAKGSITALYSVLVDADDFNEPISDAARSVLDGHIILSRRLAAQNHYPSIDILDSISRLAVDVCPPDQIELARKIRELLAEYEESRDLINIGAYVAGSNPAIDEAIRRNPAIIGFLRQGIDERYSYSETIEWMQKVFKNEAV